MIFVPLILLAPYGGFTYIVLKFQESHSPSLTGKIYSVVAFTMEYEFEHGSKSIVPPKKHVTASTYFLGVFQESLLLITLLPAVKF
jgi:hypothetical protein